MGKLYTALEWLLILGLAGFGGMLLWQKYQANEAAAQSLQQSQLFNDYLQQVSDESELAGLGANPLGYAGSPIVTTTPSTAQVG